MDIGEWELSEEIRNEIREVASALPDGSSCIATGSIIEGFGNANSDIDLYVLHDQGRPTQSIAIGLRQSRYVDCEYMTVASLRQLAARVNGHSWASVGELSRSGVDRYYRLSIGVPVQLTAAGKDCVALFDRTVARSAFAKLAFARAYEYRCRGAVAFRTGEERQARLLLRESLLWHSTSLLATAGEGYTSVKWIGEKAARRYGRDSPEFTRLLDGYLRPPVDAADAFELARRTVVVPVELREVLDRRSCALVSGVTLVTAGGRTYLVRAKEKLAPVPGAVASILSDMAGGRSWHEATALTAAHLRLPAEDLRIAAWSLLASLRSEGFIQADVPPATDK